MRRAIFRPALTHKKSGPAYADPLKKYRVKSILQAANRKAHAPDEVRVRCETLVVRPHAHHGTITFAHHSLGRRPPAGAVRRMIPLHAAVSRIERVGTEPDRNPAEFRRIVLRLIDTGPRRLRIAFDHRRKVPHQLIIRIIHGQRFGYGRLIHLAVAADRRHVRIEHVLRQLLPLGLATGCAIPRGRRRG